MYILIFFFFFLIANSNKPRTQFWLRGCRGNNVLVPSILIFFTYEKKKKKKLLKLHKDNTIKKNIFIFKKKKDR